MNKSKSDNLGKSPHRAEPSEGLRGSLMKYEKLSIEQLTQLLMNEKKQNNILQIQKAIKQKQKQKFIEAGQAKREERQKLKDLLDNQQPVQANLNDLIQANKKIQDIINEYQDMTTAKGGVLRSPYQKALYRNTINLIMEQRKYSRKQAKKVFGKEQEIKRDYEQEKIQMDKFQKELSEHLGQLIVINMEKSGPKWYKITPEFIQNFAKYTHFDEEKEFGFSDSSTGDINFMVNYSFRQPKKQKVKGQRKAGGFFAYVLKDEVDIKIQELINPFIADTPHPCLYDAICRNLNDIQQNDLMRYFNQTLSCQFTNLQSIKQLVFDGLQISVREYEDDNATRTHHFKYKEFDDKEDVVLQIGLYKNHYFYDYELNKKEQKLFEWQNKENKTIGNALKKLFQQDMFEDKEYTYEDVIENYNQTKIISMKNVESIDQDQSLQTKSKNKSKNYYTVYADTETITKDKDLQPLKSHKMFTLCAVEEDNTFNKFVSAKDFILYLNELYDKLNDEEEDDEEEEDKQKIDILVYFHNLSYDIAAFIQENCQISRELIVDGSLLKCNIGRHEFRDSHRLIPVKLKEMPDMFGLQIKKELFPYDYYTEGRTSIKYGSVKEAQQFLKPEERDEFKQNCLDIGITKTVNDVLMFDVIDYANYYCRQDCQVLRDSFERFKQIIQDNFELNLTDYLSISSLALDYQKKQGCFNGVFQLKGQLRSFVQQCVIGGRCMVSNNKKLVVQGQILDFDAVSLYPSAMKRGYYPAGKAKKLTDEQIEYYNNVDNLNQITEDEECQQTLFVEVKLKKPKTKYYFSLLSQKDEFGIRQFKNYKDEETYFMSHVYLQDVVKFQGYDYEIVSGVKFNLRNYGISECITQMFQNRVDVKQKMKTETDKDKKNGMNALQQVYKLIMNSSYGKTIESVHCTNSRLIPLDKLDDYINKNFYHIKSVQEYQNYALIVQFNDVLGSNFAQCGCLVLDYSKRIMNEVMCLAQDNGLKIYYQDTDSMHILKDDVEKLQVLFKKEYQRELIGEQMGQFHSDFGTELEGYKVMYSQKLIALGKKCYLDVLLCENEEGDCKLDYHIRLKGITQQSIDYVVENQYDGYYEALYLDLYDGNEVEFDLCKGKVMFEKDKDFQHHTLTEFKRVVKF